MSCGAIVLYCLNLPPEVRYLPENVFIVGLTPSPHKPTARHLLNLLDPLMKTILSYDLPGKKLETYTHPEGEDVSAWIVPLVADLPATRETGGFLSPSAQMFCSFCLPTNNDKNWLDYWAWPKRVGSLVLKQGRKWLKLETKTKQIAAERKTGVRGCSLHLLSYRDPVIDTILGFMHNWLEGVLEHQLRVLWGIGRDERHKKTLDEIDKDDADLWTEDEISDAGADEETQDMLNEEQSFDPDKFAAWREGYLKATATQSEVDEEEEEEEEDVTPRGSPVHIDEDEPMDGSFEGTPVPESLPPPDDEDDNDQDEEYEDVAVQGSWKLSPENIKRIQACVQEVILPTWVTRPPGNLGEKIHGKLKAEEFLNLFLVILPLIIPELQLDEYPMKHGALMTSFCNLTGATNILASFTPSPSEADQFTSFYHAYFSSILTLFPDVTPKPNHHYAMHNAEILKNWGPLASQNEFMGERINGMLQKFKTNDRVCEFYTVKISICIKYA